MPSEKEEAERGGCGCAACLAMLDRVDAVMREPQFVGKPPPRLSHATAEEIREKMREYTGALADAFDAAMIREVQANFNAEGRDNRWPDLADRTIERRRSYLEGMRPIEGVPEYEVAEADMSTGHIAELANLAIRVGRGIEPIAKLSEALEPFGVRRKK